MDNAPVKTRLVWDVWCTYIHIPAGDELSTPPLTEEEIKVAVSQLSAEASLGLVVTVVQRLQHLADHVWSEEVIPKTGRSHWWAYCTIRAPEMSVTTTNAFHCKVSSTKSSAGLLLITSSYVLSSDWERVCVALEKDMDVPTSCSPFVFLWEKPESINNLYMRFSDHPSISWVLNCSCMC